MKIIRFVSKITPLLLALLLQISAYSQAPQGISYQAVIRNGSGTPIANQPIGLRITLENASHVAYYAETQTTTSNAQGVISVTIGGGVQVGVNTFASVPWENGDVFIKLEIDPAGGTSYAAMGEPTPLKSVPYALYAENTKEVVSNPNAGDDDPIFEVKNKLGQVVFGVYQGGVRIYVEDSPIVKGAKGGFAVGGLINQAKGAPAEYMRITSDSARIYVRENSTKGAKGGFAVGGLINQAKTVVSRDFLFIAPDSARIYIDESVAPKGAKGGFAVGGLINQAKGAASYDLLRVSKDSSRIYLDQTTKGAKGGFAVGGLINQGKSNADQFLSLTPQNYFIGHQSGKSINTGVYNSFMGYKSGVSITDGSSNIFMGPHSGYSNTIGNHNVFIGDSAGYYNIGGAFYSGYQYGSDNLFVGNNSGQNNSKGFFNVFMGSKSGYHNRDGYFNTFIGASSGYNNLDADYNIFIGSEAGYSNISGSDNIFIGPAAGYYNQSGGKNIFMGFATGEQNISGTNNIFLGENSGRFNTGGNLNVFLGYYSGIQNTTGSNNICLGYLSGSKNTIGRNNISIGEKSAYRNLEGYENIRLGKESGYNNYYGKGNISIGTSAGYNAQGNKSIFIGYNAGYYETYSNNRFYLSVNKGGSLNESIDSCLIYGEFDNQIIRLNKRVGIGLTPTLASEALEVNGNVKASSFIATVGVAGAYKYSTTLNMILPDYVFDKYFDKSSSDNPVYEMLNITDLRNFIKKYHHLPRVPSRADLLKDNALNLQSFSMISLEKIEENTLYILDLELTVTKQQKIIENQQMQIDELKEKNKEIDNFKAELEAIKAMLKK